jgi:hypothetical protein
MATCNFILSTGRTSTQNIAYIASRAYPDAIVEHEGLKSRYRSRAVFRRPKNFPNVLGSHVYLQRKLIDIEDTIATGTTYMDVGWPVYAWIPYLVKRFGKQIRFAHLIRNPFLVAASLTTHGLFGGRLSRWERLSMIHPTDKNAKFQGIFEPQEKVSAFEHNLFHWLELNYFMSEQHGLDGFVGLFRYEDLYVDEGQNLAALLEVLMGSGGGRDLKKSSVDRVQRKLPERITKLNPRLLDEVMKFAMNIGYTEAELTEAADLEGLNEYYLKKRL